MSRMSSEVQISSKNQYRKVVPLKKLCGHKYNTDEERNLTHIGSDAGKNHVAQKEPTRGYGITQD